MATIVVDSDRVRVRLTTAEKIWALRGDLSFPRDAIHAVTVEPDGLHATRGVRAPGLGLPGRRKVGTWRGRAGREFVSVRAGQPAVRITLTGQRYDSVLVGADHADACAEAVRHDR
ncbi:MULTISPECIES: hypothetical protein [Micromonospora]|uniref:Bacterial Pleckstrin homology domain-containing protein n=1 Tax=Micromonospora solifontis TaxID=2487138 RepID=A0ABX9WBL1_9ACTN|nr:MULTISPECIES: hypothetical protein [Micromonospora]NES13739.1 hypothetical protein [Micromonospora sp. PPF5-17B]NES39219.1 hypothetical protein [Micromonospora solifontis]NES55294.1 hypothetical protein [Micromonospora sp. PPF5-6]RNL89919.1 hypothetical protein EFE23_24270 [Micromonospora solifontis]